MIRAVQRDLDVAISNRLATTRRLLWVDILREIGIIAAVYLVYSWSRGSIDADATIAYDHARDIVQAENNLGIFVEPHIQSFFLKNSFNINLANTLYTIVCYPALLLFAVWCYRRHREQFKTMRNVFVVITLLAVTVFALFPTSPPRFFDGNNIGAENLGFVDTLVTNWHVYGNSSQAFYNPYAAMPSCHFAWALMMGIGIWWMTRSIWGRMIGVLLPVATFVAIVATANHYILDAVGGATVVGLSFGIVVLLQRRYAGKKTLSTVSNTNKDA